MSLLPVFFCHPSFRHSHPATSRKISPRDTRLFVGWEGRTFRPEQHEAPPEAVQTLVQVCAHYEDNGPPTRTRSFLRPARLRCCNVVSANKHCPSCFGEDDRRHNIRDVSKGTHWIGGRDTAADSFDFEHIPDMFGSLTLRGRRRPKTGDREPHLGQREPQSIRGDGLMGMGCAREAPGWPGDSTRLGDEVP